MSKKLREKANEQREKRNKPVLGGVTTFADEFKSPEKMADERRTTVPKVEAVTPFVQTDGKPSSTISQSAPLAPVVGQEVVQNDASAPVNAATKPLTFSDMLEAQRQNIVKDKTDAVKMQKYYALTDALKALGQMGGAAVGGAIGGGVLDSAPSVPEYKESRGYLDAVERARKANDRLRALEEQDFNLAYSKQQRDEERAYNEKNRKEEREYQAEQARITREWNKAVADGDFAKKAQLEKDLLNLRNQHSAEDDQRSMAYLQMQYDLYNKPQPVMFSDGTIANLTSDQLSTMLENYKGKEVGGVKITKDNFGEVLRNNPKEFAGYLKMIGVNSTVPTYDATEEKKPKAQAGAHPFPAHISQIPAEYVVGGNRATGVPVNPNLKKNEEPELEGVEWV